MPAGDLITEDWQVELNGLLTGAGTIYQLGDRGIDGLGVPKAKTQDVDLVQQHGAEAGAPDVMSVRVLLIPYVIVVDGLDNGWNALTLLNIAWEPVAADVELHAQLPGWGHIYWTGRPRGLDIEAQYARTGEFTGIAEFHCLDPVHTVVSS